VIFASAVGRHSNSLRAQHTVLPLSQALNLVTSATHAKDEIDNLVNDAISRTGNVLIAWEHEKIPAIANKIVGDNTTCPQEWTDKRFDMVWVFDRLPGGRWSFTQVAQMLLPGDSCKPI
jgi:hypothetical protein